MTVEGHMARRALAISAGIAAITASAALNVTHLVEGGQALVSPMAGAKQTRLYSPRPSDFLRRSWRSCRHCCSRPH